jgi:hypothetical protein
MQMQLQPERPPIYRHPIRWYRRRAGPWTMRKLRRRGAQPPEGGPKRPEAADLPLHIEAHRDNVWLALASLSFAGGLALVTAAWLGALTIAAAPTTARIPGTLEAFGWALLAVGAFGIGAAVYIFVAFFRHLPLRETLKEMQEKERKARALPAAPSVSEIPKPDEVQTRT